MVCYINLLIPLFMVIIAVKLLKTDNIDRNNPFGTDSIKNKKYAKGKVGEDYGAGTFWGKPSQNDEILDNLNKIGWLSGSTFKDVHWRRSLSIGILGGIFVTIGLDTKFLMDPSKLFFLISTIFIFSYFTMSYYQHHFLWRRNKFINTHIRKIKSKLNLPLYNKINENVLI